MAETALGKDIRITVEDLIGLSGPGLAPCCPSPSPSV